MPISADFQNRLNPILEAVIDHFGTPFHIYDEKGIRNTGEGLIAAFSGIDDFKEYFAVKALPNPNILRIRIGTRTPVTLPQRITDSLVDIVARYQSPGKREVVIVTHFEHLYEITPEATKAVQKFRRSGIEVYNQLVYTFFNSRKFETAALRQKLLAIALFVILIELWKLLQKAGHGLDLLVAVRLAKRDEIGDVHRHRLVVIEAHAPSADIEPAVLHAFKRVKHVHDRTAVMFLELHRVFSLRRSALGDPFGEHLAHRLHIVDEGWVA